MGYIGSLQPNMPTVENPATGAGAPEDSLRQSLIDAARDGWTSRLIDLSRRNNLLFYKPIQSATLELPVTPSLMGFLTQVKPLPIGDLLASDQDRISHIRSISRKGLENLEEKGLSTLYLALGRCTWTADDGGRDPVAPVLLIPISLKLKGQDVKATEVQVIGEAQINPVLLHVFHQELNVSITPEELLSLFSLQHNFVTNGSNGSAATGLIDASEEDERTIDANLDAVLVRLNKVAIKVPGFKSEAFAVIGNFSFQKLAMVKDLEARRSELLANDVVAAIAGDNAARRKLSGSQVETDPSSLDDIPPDNEFAVLEADSSQQCAIAGITVGQSAVVHGPPGTGKSQTITNLIATLTANGKKILFVAEKRAALEVVMNRLTAVGLDHLAIDLHGAEQTPKKVMERVARTLTAVREAGKPESEDIHEQFADRRNKLNQHDDTMHRAHAPTELTVFAMQGALLRLPSNVSSTLRWRGPDLTQITSKNAGRVLDLLGEAAGFESLFNRSDSSPWTGVELKDGQAVQGAIDLTGRLAHELLPELTGCLNQAATSSELRPPKTMAETQELLALLERTAHILDSYDSAVFLEADALIQAMSPSEAGGLKGIWYRLTNSAYKNAYKKATTLRRGNKVSGAIVFKELSEAEQVRSIWQVWAGSNTIPKAIDERIACSKIFQTVQARLQELQTICNANWNVLTLAEISAKVSALSADTSTPYRIRRLCEIEQELKSLGVQRLVDEIRATRRPAAQWPALFRYVWLQSTLDMAAINDPSIRGFVGSTHNGYVDDFKRLDATRLELASKRVRRAHAERTIAAMNQFPEQETLIRGEAAKSRRHKPLRQIFAQAGNVLTAVCPCWMASPLSVCQLIAATNIFDYVIFDEASQVAPEDAIPAILRGKHVIVAGDNKQLPPSAFFAAADEDDESDLDATAYESLLDMMIPFVKGFHLNWHYRSRDEALISFSNHHIYDDRLVTFPGPGGSTAISHVFVDYLPSSDGQEDSSGGEVDKVVEMVLEHAQNRPDLTLGVITMGIKHANRIQAVLDRELSKHPDLAEFFDTGRPERFFVKNLERVQGDERDVIIMSIGYGKDRAGNLPLRFGPILSAGGRRRLNVAATRAKERVIVVSSFRYSDINSTQVRPGTGLEFLKNYLEYAGSEGRLLFHGELTNEPMDDFELEVFDALTAEGIALVPQVGCSRFRIDLAALHPTKQGQFVLAIECDGATYHSSYTARDRDRLRQRQLENLGWTFHRIWSTDWFMRRDEEVARAVQAFKKAVAEGDRPKPMKTLSPNPTSVAKVFDKFANDNPASRRSSPIAPIPKRESITEYTAWELQALLQWVQSDGKLRTNDELADEMFAALPFARRGARIEAVLRRAIRISERTTNS
jgi:very-short-patch-repair endonuclease